MAIVWQATSACNPLCSSQFIIQNAGAAPSPQGITPVICVTPKH